jgi:hypothetical protein
MFMTFYEQILEAERNAIKSYPEGVSVIDCDTFKVLFNVPTLEEAAERAKDIIGKTLIFVSKPKPLDFHTLLCSEHDKF